MNILNKKMLALAIMTSTIMSLPAHALQMTAQNSWTLASGSTVTTDTDTASSGSVDVLDGASDTSGNSIFYHTYGNQSGNFGSRSSGEGDFDISGQYDFSEDYVAAGGTAFFDFTVIPGEINVFGLLNGQEQLSASYSLEIFVNNSNVWSSGVSINSDAATGSTFTYSGESINGVETTDGYYWGTFTEQLDLGTFTAGEIINISYSLKTDAFGNISDTSSCGSSNNPLDGDGIGDGIDGIEEPALAIFDGGVDGEVGGIRIGDGGYNSTCGAIARIGDPNGLSQPGANTFNVTGATAVSVPEPGILALLASGLFGIALVRRRV